MSINKDCKGHLNGFVHLEGGYNGLGKEFDLGIKYEDELKESDEYSENPVGVKAYAEPFLAMYISVNNEKTFRYGITRQKLESIGVPTEQDKKRLLEKAYNQITNDLTKLKNGEKPESLNKFIFL